MKIIGKGSGGKVYSDNNLAKKKLVGIKNLLEPFIYQYVQHPNLMHSNDIQIKDNIFYIYQDIADCDLSQYLKNSLKKNVRKDICLQLCRGVEKLHSLGIIHCDIKPQNILVFSKDTGLSKHKNGRTTVKLTDFGLSRFENMKCECSYKLYTYTYKSENILNNGDETYYDDIWSLACTLYEIMYNHMCFKKIGKENIRVKNSCENDNIFNDLIESIFEGKIRDIEGVLKHPFFRSTPIETKNIKSVDNHLEWLASNYYDSKYTNYNLLDNYYNIFEGECFLFDYKYYRYVLS